MKLKEIARARLGQEKRSLRREMFLRNLVWYAGGKQQKIEALVKGNINFEKCTINNSLYHKAEILKKIKNCTPWCKMRCTVTTHQAFRSLQSLNRWHKNDF